jgi:hypothetical protein
MCPTIHCYINLYFFTDADISDFSRQASKTSQMKGYCKFDLFQDVSKPVLVNRIKKQKKHANLPGLDMGLAIDAPAHGRCSQGPRVCHHPRGPVLAGDLC